MIIKEAFGFTHSEVKRFHDEREASAITSLIFNDLGFTSVERVLYSENELGSDSEKRIHMILSGLKKNIPIQYILGYTWFIDLKIEVNANVLIPRPETEELTDLIVKKHRDENCNILDIGTGSGCIALALKKNIKSSIVSASDISASALKTAERNAYLNQLNIGFIQDDILHPDLKKYEAYYDIIVSNPPYVTESDKKQMHTNVLNYEPPLALYVSDSDPLIFYRAIGEFAFRNLKPGGSLYLEINESFGKETRTIFDPEVYSTIEVVKDIHGKDRFIYAVKR